MKGNDGNVIILLGRKQQKSYLKQKVKKKVPQLLFSFSDFYLATSVLEIRNLQSLQAKAQNESVFFFFSEFSLNTDKLQMDLTAGPYLEYPDGTVPSKSL